MTADALLEFLTDEIADGNEAFVTSLLATARAKIAAGGGMIAPLVNASLNGKSFSRNVQMNAVEVAAACRMALAAEDGDDVVSSGLDFSHLGTLD